MQRRHYYDQLISVSDFSGPWSECIKGFKYRAQLSLARPLTDLLLQRIRHLQVPDHGWASWQVIGMPMARRRRWRRGYNQAELLAQRIACGLGAPYLTTVKRVIHTPALEKQSRLERARTMNQVFTAPSLQGGCLVIDDVFTTGASVNELARTLRTQGAQRIVVATLARTPINGDNHCNWLGQVFHDTLDATDETGNPQRSAKRW
ncbi:ComF family protein [Salinispirillum marinum]|uniref:ComF family protein n=2 Tax=Saccharospirillaceae TaxID=255527 RepID=A0ABV8BJW6_9GAMM